MAVMPMGDQHYWGSESETSSDLICFVGGLLHKRKAAAAPPLFKNVTWKKLAKAITYTQQPDILEGIMRISSISSLPHLPPSSSPPLSLISHSSHPNQEPRNWQRTFRQRMDCRVVWKWSRKRWLMVSSPDREICEA